MLSGCNVELLVNSQLRCLELARSAPLASTLAVFFGLVVGLFGLREGRREVASVSAPDNQLLDPIPTMCRCK